VNRRRTQGLPGAQNQADISPMGSSESKREVEVYSRFSRRIRKRFVDDESMESSGFRSELSQVSRRALRSSEGLLSLREISSDSFRKPNSTKVLFGVPRRVWIP